MRNEMKRCVSCGGEWPDRLVAMEEYATASSSKPGGIETREVCVLCREYLPITFLSCYNVDREEWLYRNHIRWLARRVADDLHQTCEERTARKLGTQGFRGD